MFGRRIVARDGPSIRRVCAAMFDKGVRILQWQRAQKEDERFRGGPQGLAQVVGGIGMGHCQAPRERHHDQCHAVAKG
eukprot:11160410-Lingulodinium_polyedra.AAC.1